MTSLAGRGGDTGGRLRTAGAAREHRKLKGDHGATGVQRAADRRDVGVDARPLNTNTHARNPTAAAGR